MTYAASSRKTCSDFSVDLLVKSIPWLIKDSSILGGVQQERS